MYGNPSASVRLKDGSALPGRLHFPTLSAGSRENEGEKDPNRKCLSLAHEKYEDPVGCRSCRQQDVELPHWVIPNRVERACSSLGLRQLRFAFVQCCMAKATRTERTGALLAHIIRDTTSTIAWSPRYQCRAMVGFHFSGATMELRSGAVPIRPLTAPFLTLTDSVFHSGIPSRALALNGMALINTSAYCGWTCLHTSDNLAENDRFESNALRGEGVVQLFPQSIRGHSDARGRRCSCQERIREIRIASSRLDGRRHGGKSRCMPRRHLVAPALRRARLSSSNPLTSLPPYQGESLVVPSWPQLTCG